MPNYCIMRMQKSKSTAQASARLKHARREIPCKTVINPNAKNVNICSDYTRQCAGKSFREIFRERTQGQKIRKNAVHAVEVVLTFSPGAVAPESLENWARANMEWISENFGGSKNIIDARLHMDETTPHIHAMVIPIDDKGRLNARAFLGGTSHRMSDLQTEYAKAMEPFGLERGVSREITGAKHQAHQRWISSNAEKEANLQAYEAVFKPMLDKNLELTIEFTKERSKALQEPSNALQRDIPDTREK